MSEDRSLNIASFRTMLILQDRLNSIINPDWIHAGYPFLRAAFVEAAEAMDHHGWKWWKNQAPDMYQLQIELIDILHFYLSDVLVCSGGKIEESLQVIILELKEESVLFDGKLYCFDEMEILELIELTGAMAACRRRSFAMLVKLMEKSSLAWVSAYSQYIFKNVLNLFRQDNGYRTGSYIKIWDGEEDNVWLEKIANKIDIESNSFPDQLRTMLEEKYLEVKSKEKI